MRQAVSFIHRVTYGTMAVLLICMLSGCGGEKVESTQSHQKGKSEYSQEYQKKNKDQLQIQQAVTISCGGSHAGAVLNDTTLWMWGSNYYGQLGNDRQGDRETSIGTVYQSVPIQVMEDVKAVSCGQYHTAAIKTDGTLWAWGLNNAGQVGNGKADGQEIRILDGPYNSSGDIIQTVPIQVMENVTAVACGAYHTAAIQEDGSLWMWGLNENGQLGNNGEGSDEMHVYKSDYTIQTIPVKIMDDVAMVSCGEDFTIAIKTDGSLWAWGDNSCGQLGQEKTSGNHELHTPVKVMEDVATVSCGANFAAVIKNDGHLWMCGMNRNSQLGNDYEGNDDRAGQAIQTIPVDLMEDVVAVSCGGDFTAVIKTDGELWMWGSHEFRQVNTPFSSTAVPQQSLNGEKVIAISCGDGFAAALKPDGTLWTWGHNNEGQTGNGGDSTEAGMFGGVQRKEVQILGNVAFDK